MTKELFKKMSPWLLLAIIVGVAIGIFLVYMYVREQKADFTNVRERRLGPVPTDIAIANASAYRDNGAYLSLSFHKKAKVMGIWHDAAAFGKYATEGFKRFRDTHDSLRGYTWQIGIYPMVFKGPFDNGTHPRIGIYFIPTMVDSTNPNNIVDFLDVMGTADEKYYEKLSQLKLSPNSVRVDPDSIAFDEGHLWP